MKKLSDRFDCVEMMHEGALRIHEELKGKSREEQLAYWRARNKQVREDHPKLRSLDQAKPAAK